MLQEYTLFETTDAKMIFSESTLLEFQNPSITNYLYLVAALQQKICTTNVKRDYA